MAAAAGLPSSPPLPAGAQGGERLREMGEKRGREGVGWGNERDFEREKKEMGWGIGR